MYIYLMKDKELEFMDFLKENRLSDDIILDRDNFNKNKIKLHIKNETVSLIEKHFLVMPEDTTFTYQLESPGKEYVLCIGDVNDSDFFVFLKNINHCALTTRKSNGVRINAWIHFNHLYNLWVSGVVTNMTSIGGAIRESIWICFEPFPKKHSQLAEKVFPYSDECIIKEGQVYVKCLTHDFSKLIKNAEDCYETFYIVDEDTI